MCELIISSLIFLMFTIFSESRNRLQFTNTTTHQWHLTQRTQAAVSFVPTPVYRKLFLDTPGPQAFIPTLVFINSAPSPSSPTSNSHASRDPPGLPARSEPLRAGQADSSILTPSAPGPRASREGPRKLREAQTPGGAGKGVSIPPYTHTRRAHTPLPALSSPALCERAAGRGRPGLPAGPVSSLPPAGLPATETATASPGNRPRRQSTGRGVQARLTYGAAATALPQPGTPTVGHTAASPLAVLPLSRLRWRQDLLSPPTSPPPTPTPSSFSSPSSSSEPPEVLRVRHRDSQQHGYRRLPSPPRLHRARAKHSGRKGKEGGGGRRGRGGSAHQGAAPPAL